MANSGKFGDSEPSEEGFPSKPAAEFARINKAATPDAGFGALQAMKTSSGERNMPPPVPVRPERKPIAAPAIIATSTGGSLVSLSAASLRGHNIRTADSHRITPTSGRYQCPGKAIAPPTKASGTAPIRNGQTTRQRNNPARRYLKSPSDATTRLSTSAVGFIVCACTPNSAIIAI